MKVWLDTTPLSNANSIRGVGAYTRFLSAALGEVNDIELVKSANSNPEVIHYPYFDLFFASLPLRHSAPYIITIHDVIPLLFPDKYPVGIKGKVHFWRQRWRAQQAAAIITDSKASKADIVQHLDIPASKVHVVYLAANPELKTVSQAQSEQILKVFKLPKKYMLYIGDINYNKNIPGLLQAMVALPNELHLVCVGKNFKSQPIPEWQAIAHHLTAVKDRVHFLTEIPADGEKTLAALYQQAELYVQPSFYEGFGLPLLEAMQCQTPVVSTCNSSLIEVGGDVVVFTQPEPSSLAQGILEVLSWKSTQRQTRIERASAWAETFSWAKTARETVKVYQEVMKAA